MDFIERDGQVVINCKKSIEMSNDSKNGEKEEVMQSKIKHVYSSKMETIEEQLIEEIND